ncbi:MAG TPA: hypothetical protein VGV10_04695 [Thermoleophilaceae bacterium]|nr:hypothetical protein [Thermoleophilaceae bacterium]
MSEERRSGPHGEHRHKPEDDAADPGRRSEPVPMKDDPAIPDPSGDEPSESERDSTLVNDSSSEGGGGQSG